jgi:hypothetical protein
MESPPRPLVDAYPDVAECVLCERYYFHISEGQYLRACPKHAAELRKIWYGEVPTDVVRES